MTVVTPPAPPTLKRLRLTIAGTELIGQQPGESGVYVEQVEPDGTLRALGALVIPSSAVPHLGVLGLLVGLKMIESLEIAGPGAPVPLDLEPRVLRLLKIAAKVLA